MNAPRTTATRVAVFNLVGAIGFAVQLGLLWLLVRVFSVAVLPATALAVEGAIIHNFVWHRSWTWGDRVVRPGETMARFLRFNLANGAVSLVVNVALMALLHLVLHVPYLVANTAAVLCACAVNFLLGDRVVFPADDVRPAWVAGAPGITRSRRARKMRAQAGGDATPPLATRQIPQRCAAGPRRG